MELTETYKSAIRTKVCSVCIDRSPTGACAISEDPDHRCVLYDFLPEVVELIEENFELDLEALEQKLRDTVCAQCRENVEGHCKLRENVDCALDRYFPLILEAVEEVRNYRTCDVAEESEEYRSVTHRAFEEHHKLHEAENDLRRLSKACQSAATEENIKRLHEGLKEFRRMLLDHMAFEESDGFMQPVLNLRPTLEPRVSDLASDHDMFRAEMDSLIRDVENKSAGVSVGSQVADRVLKLLRELRRHEADENSLILEVFHQDIGEKD